MKKSPLRNERGFTLIEIIAVLVILGILAAFAIPKYVDMRESAIVSAGKAAAMELSARERLALAHWKLKSCSGDYPSVNVVGADCKSGVEGATGDGPSTELGPDWPNSVTALSTAGGQITFQGKTVYFTRTRTNATDINEPYYWSSSLTASTPTP